MAMSLDRLPSSAWICSHEQEPVRPGRLIDVRPALAVLRQRQRDSARHGTVYAVSRLALREQPVAGAVGFDLDVVEAPPQHRVPAVLELPADYGALKLFDRGCHRHPPLPHFDGGKSLFCEGVQCGAGKMRVDTDPAHVETVGEVSDAVFNRPEIDHVAGRRLDMAFVSPSHIRNAVPILPAPEVIGGAEEMREHGVPVAHLPGGNNHRQVGIAGQVNANPLRKLRKSSNAAPSQDERQRGRGPGWRWQLSLQHPSS